MSNQQNLDFNDFYFNELFNQVRASLSKKLEPQRMVNVDNFLEGFLNVPEKGSEVEKLAEKPLTGDLSLFFSDLIERIDKDLPVELISRIETSAMGLSTLMEDLANQKDSEATIKSYAESMLEARSIAPVSLPLEEKVSAPKEEAGFAEFYDAEIVKKVREKLLYFADPFGFMIGAGLLDEISKAENKAALPDEWKSISSAQSIGEFTFKLFNQIHSSTADMPVLLTELDNNVQTFVDLLSEWISNAPQAINEYLKTKRAETGKPIPESAPVLPETVVAVTGHEVIPGMVKEQKADQIEFEPVKKEIIIPPEMVSPDEEIIFETEAPVSAKKEETKKPRPSKDKAKRETGLKEDFKFTSPKPIPPPRPPSTKQRLSKYFQNEVRHLMEEMGSHYLEIKTRSSNGKAFRSVLNLMEELKEISNIHGYRAVNRLADTTLEFFSVLKSMKIALNAEMIEDLLTLRGVFEKASNLDAEDRGESLVSSAKEILSQAEAKARKAGGIIPPPVLKPAPVESPVPEKKFVSKGNDISLDEFITDHLSQLSPDVIQRFGLMGRAEGRESIEAGSEIQLTEFIKSQKSIFPSEVVSRFELNDLMEEPKKVVPERKTEAVHPKSGMALNYGEKKIPSPDFEMMEPEVMAGIFSEADGFEKGIVDETKVIVKPSATQEDQEILTIFREEAGSYLRSLDQAIETLDKEIGNPKAIKEVERASHSLKGSARMLGFETVSQLVAPIETIAELAAQGKFQFSKYALVIISEAIHWVKQHIESGVPDNKGMEEVLKKLQDLETATTQISKAESEKIETSAAGPAQPVSETKEEMANLEIDSMDWINEIDEALREESQDANQNLAQNEFSSTAQETSQEVVEVEGEAKEQIDNILTGDEELISIFKEEASGYLALLEKTLNMLGENIYDVKSMKEIERASHSLKGSAKMLGFGVISKLVGPMEAVAEKVLNGGIQFSPEMRDVCLRTVQTVRDLLDPEKRSGVNITSLVNQLNDFKRGVRPGKSSESVPQVKMVEKETIASEGEPITEETFLDEIPALSEAEKTRITRDQQTHIPTVEEAISSAGSVSKLGIQFAFDEMDQIFEETQAKVGTSSYDELLKIFREETHAPLESLQKALLILSNSPENNSAMRSAEDASHSLSRSAEIMHFSHIFALTSAIENAVQKSRIENKSFTPLVLNGIKRIMDYIQKIFTGQPYNLLEATALLQPLKDLIGNSLLNKLLDESIKKGRGQKSVVTDFSGKKVLLDREEWQNFISVVERLLASREIFNQQFEQVAKFMESLKGLKDSPGESVPPANPESTPVVNRNSISELKPDPLKGDGQRILIADDSISIRKFVSDLLNKVGYLTTLAANREEAFGVIRKESFHLLITDLDFEKMNGPRIVEDLCREAKAKGIPILLLTARRSEAEKEMEKRLAPAGAMVKPFKEQELYEGIAHLIFESKK